MNIWSAIDKHQSEEAGWPHKQGGWVGTGYGENTLVLFLQSKILPIKGRGGWDGDGKQSVQVCPLVLKS